MDYSTLDSTRIRRKKKRKVRSKSRNQEVSPKMTSPKEVKKQKGRIENKTSRPSQNVIMMIEQY